MKTSVNIIRKMNDFDVIQRTKDSMFNATALINQWNDLVEKDHTQNSGYHKKKEITKFFDNKQTKEFIKVLVDEEKLDTQNSAYVKSRANKGDNAGTWMHPYLFIKFAMWLNPKFEYHVIKFVYDELIQNRKLSGAFYNKLCSLLSRFKDTDYREVGKILNYVVFNEHVSDRRNSATPEQQEDLQQLERDACNYIENGFIANWEHFKSVMRREWVKRHDKTPKVFA